MHTLLVVLPNEMLRFEVVGPKMHLVRWEDTPSEVSKIWLKYFPA